jgi:hypothetical protein
MFNKGFELDDFSLFSGYRDDAFTDCALPSSVYKSDPT